MKLNTIDNIKIINLEHINTNNTVIHIFDKLEKVMNVKRVFFIHSKKINTVKGHHAHKIDQQIISCINGSIEFFVTDGKKNKKFILNKPSKLIFVPKHIWTETKYLKSNTSICVFSSSHYNEKSYIRSYDDYLNFRKSNKH